MIEFVRCSYSDSEKYFSVGVKGKTVLEQCMKRKHVERIDKMEIV